MGHRTTYTPGTFCWADLATTDTDAAKTFYAGLFGWEAEDMPVPGGGVYSMQRLGGADVAAIAPQPPQQAEAGAPPMWNSYVRVDSADDAVARLRELGVEPHGEPFDVMEAGRMAVVQDPQGAYVLLWEPGRHDGAGLVNAPGALAWNELATTDLDAAATFYGGLFGWETEPMETGGPRYLIIRNDDRGNGGIREVTPPGTPPHWLAYFGTADIGKSLAEAERLGGSTLVGDTDIGAGHIAVVQDPQGAVFALFAGDFED